MKPDAPEALEKLFLAIRDLRKAERRSLQACENSGPGVTSQKRWTAAAIERDRCYEYAKDVARDYFGFRIVP